MALGPAFALGKYDSTWTVRFGVSPTLLSDEVVGNKDLGGQLHFTSHLAIPNPGLEVHALQVSGTF